MTGLDIVKAQIRIAEGGRLGQLDETGIPPQEQHPRSTATPCNAASPPRIPTTISFPITAASPPIAAPSASASASTAAPPIPARSSRAIYDPLLEKVTAWAPTPEEVIARMDRALREYRIRGVATNLAFLEAVLNHPKFRAGDYTTRFIDETPELFAVKKRRDRATKLLTYIADVTVNGHPETRGRPKPPADARAAGGAAISADAAPPRDAATAFERLGPERLRRMDARARRACSSPTRRCATRTSRCSRRACAPTTSPPSPSAYASGLPQLFSLECWGGATFDVAMRFLERRPVGAARASCASARPIS